MDLEPEGIVPPDSDVAVGNDPAVREIERLLESGKIEEGLLAIDAAMAAGRGNSADLTFLRGDACLGLGLAREAEREFRSVLQGDPDCPSSRCWLAMSLYLQWRFVERKGNYREADGLFERAATASPDKYSVPVRMLRDEFDREVQEAVGALPPQFQGYLDQVPVIVQELPDAAFARSDANTDADILSPDMLGLFDGTPIVDEWRLIRSRTTAG